MRNFLVVAFGLALAVSSAEASVSAYPASYHSRGRDYYESLRAAKLAWLNANAAALAGDIAADRAAAGTPRGGKDMPAALDRLSRQAASVAAEIAIMRGRRDARQETLLKRNVQAWIGAARRGGNGSLAIRLMHDLEGTGL